jgi:hypothetical protein
MHAKQTLAHNLTHDEFASIEAVNSIRDLHSIASTVQELSKRRSRWSKGRTLLLTLNRYRGVLDVIAQAHAEYTCLAWGAIKWILTVAVSYMNLLQRISAMLEDIGYRLPRIQLYQNLLPSKRLVCVISELYAAIIVFFTQTILFFNKSRTRRLFSILYGSLETEFHAALDRIGRLSDLVEGDARAAAVASQHAANAALNLQLQEVKLITRHAMQSVLEVKQLQAKYLLQDVRTNLFFGLDQELTFQYDMVKLWTALVAPEWNLWYRTEMFHIPFYQQKQAAFAYVQTDQLQFLIGLNIMSQKICRPDYAAQTLLCWSQSMTMETALASLIYQYLELYPEKLLFRHGPGYYACKMRDGSQTFDSLLEIYVQIVAALSGSVSMIIVPFESPEASTFIRKMIDLCYYWSSRLHSMIIYHVTDPVLSDSPGVVEVDKEYDIDIALDTSENFYRVSMMCFGVFGNLTENVQTNLWSSLWRALRYSLIVVTFDTVVAEAEASFRVRTEQHASLNQRRLAGQSLKRKIIAFFQCVERDMPDTCRQYLAQLMKDARSAGVLAGTTKSQPLTRRQQLAIWTITKKIFDDLITQHFVSLVRDQLSVMTATSERSEEDSGLLGALQAVEGIFLPIGWHQDCLILVQQAIRANLQQAAADGLKQIVEIYVSSLEAEQDNV